MTVSIKITDWPREKKRPFQRDPSRTLLASIRSYQRHIESRNPFHIIMLYDCSDYEVLSLGPKYPLAVKL